MNQNICYNCFRERTDSSGSCPHCGYDPAADQGKYPFALPHGSILAGQFITGRVLGQGGFGITYLARDNKLDTKVAIKEFLPDSMAVRATGDHQVTVYTGQRQENFQYGMERFLDEARVLAKFQGNPSIVGVRSYFEENGTAYFVMDYIEGDSFKTYIQKQGGKVSWQEAVRILTPVMDALGAVHQEGIIHRDVTPDNIILTSDGGVKLLDFGSARYSLGDKSKSLDVVLKAGYAPKEQYIRRGKQGPYTDVYSLAACFYAAITGYLPPEALERMDEDELVPPSTRGAKLPAALEDVILKGLEVQPGDRYQSMEEFRSALDAALRDDPVPNPIPDPNPNPDPNPVPDPVPDPKPNESLLERIKALPKAVKGGAAAAACLVIVLGALAGSGVFATGKPSPIDSGEGGSVQDSGDLQRTAQDGGIGQLEGPEQTVSADDAAAPKESGQEAEPAQEVITPEVNSETADEEKAAAEKAAAEKAATEKAAAEKAAAEKAAAEKAAAEKAAAEKAAAEKAAAEKAAAEKAAAEKAAAEKAAAEKAAAEKAAAEKAAAEKAAAEKAAAEKAAAEKAAAEEAAVTKVTNQPYTMVTSKFSVKGTYTGEWKDGKPNGTGTMTMAQSDQRWDIGDTLYSAKWVNGLIEGYGEWRSAVDGAYNGNFSKGLKSGYGKMWFSDGTVYDGQWSGGDFVG